MPYKDLNCQAAKDSKKRWRDKNKKYAKDYSENNPEKIKISMWKFLGINLREGEDWESIYLYYITCENCEVCDRKLTDDKIITSTRRCLDHDHSTGFIRNVLCHSCNIKRN
jgi:hypothetical protein